MKKDLITILDKYEYVSFDIFDTIIVRSVDKPEDVFRIMEETANKYLIDNFSEKRKRAEKRATENTKRGEITLDEIYENLDAPFAVANIMKEEEIETELSVCKANPYFKSVLEFCKVTNKKAVVISDMYLSSSVIRKILTNAGINVDYVFVSADFGCRKSRGVLYKTVLKELGIKPCNIVHIGDNLKSDYMMAKLNGIKAIWYNEKNKYKK